MEHPIELKANDLDRSSAILEQNSTLIMVIWDESLERACHWSSPRPGLSSVDEAWRRRRRAAPVAAALARGDGRV